MQPAMLFFEWLFLVFLLAGERSLGLCKLLLAVRVQAMLTSTLHSNGWW